MSLYRSKPSIIEAVHWTGDNYDEVRAALGAKVHTDIDRNLMLHAGKDGAQKWVPVPVGHWLVHQPDDLTDIWPVEADYFAAKYEDVP